MKTGLEVLCSHRGDLVAGRRIGLITNPTGVDRTLRPSIECIRQINGARLTALYGPEHGVRGNAQAGEYVPFYRDEQYGLPVFSLYGQSHQPPADMLTNIDAYMRSFDTQHTGKTVDRGMIESIDVMIYDLQDVGTRVYTYVATMAYAMQAAAEAGIPFVVLDRPNPVGGLLTEGPILEYPQYSSFIGLYPVPLRHGLTAGELARLFNAKFLKRPVELTVVPMEGWRRSDWFAETGLPWVIPSPNMPTPDTATVYPGQVMLEGTNLSEGRGTTRPFEFFGAPWIDGHVLTRELNALSLPGVVFRENWFTPSFSKFSGERCGGCQVHVHDRERYRPISATLEILHTVRRLYGDRLELHADYFDRVMGTDSVRLAMVRNEAPATIAAGWEKGLDEFARTCEPFLLYT